MCRTFINLPFCYTHHSHQIYHGMIGRFLMSCFRAEPFLLFVFFAVGKNDFSQKSIEIKSPSHNQVNKILKNNTHLAKKNQLTFGERPLFCQILLIFYFST